MRLRLTAPFVQSIAPEPSNFGVSFSASGGELPVRAIGPIGPQYYGWVERTFIHGLTPHMSELSRAGGRRMASLSRAGGRRMACTLSAQTVQFVTLAVTRGLRFQV
jgi:hypothetical protein